MKASILVSSLATVALSISIASANEMTSSTYLHLTLNSADLNELPVALPLSQVTASHLHFAMMDEKEDMDKMEGQDNIDDQDNMDKKDKMKNKGDMKKMHDKNHMHKMDDKDKMKNKGGKAKSGAGKKGVTKPSSKKPAPMDSNPPSSEKSEMPPPMADPAPMNDM